jgi:exodeoxyribonuclease V alpha subunit
LPSIGPECVFKNLLDSCLFSQTKLTVIKRQQGVLMNNIKKMTTELITREDLVDQTMCLLDVDHFIDEENEINHAAIKSLIENENIHMHNSKFISYFQDEKFSFNVTTLNIILQSIFNPSGEIIHSRSRFKERFRFKVGDIIIRTENDYSSGDIKANGEQSIIKAYNDTLNLVWLENIQDKKECKTDIQTLYEDFSMAYALTIHKAQGSQYDNIIIFIDKNQKIWDKPALYTAISRAKEKCLVIAREVDFESIQYGMRSIKEKISLFMKESDNYEFEE